MCAVSNRRPVARFCGPETRARRAPLQKHCARDNEHAQARARAFAARNHEHKHHGNTHTIARALPNACKPPGRASRAAPSHSTIVVGSPRRHSHLLAPVSCRLLSLCALARARARSAQITTAAHFEAFLRVLARLGQV